VLEDEVERECIVKVAPGDMQNISEKQPLHREVTTGSGIQLNLNRDIVRLRPSQKARHLNMFGHNRLLRTSPKFFGSTKQNHWEQAYIKSVSEERKDAFDYNQAVGITKDDWEAINAMENSPPPFLKFCQNETKNVSDGGIMLSQMRKITRMLNF